ncbi:protein FAR1-RELATED SEQUENCE 5-like [Silene latifolia]|uniref:protein FAR1-RELATED SEQUENCE 5-like n=1 Tax=Silene latifolia TaxID=37657 RepID=UPI003D782DBF
MDADSTDINMQTGSACYNINVTVTQSHIFISIAHITYDVPLLDVLLFSHLLHFVTNTRIFLFVHDSNLVTQPHSTPIVQEQPNPQPNNQLVLSHTPNGGERWMRVVEHKFRPTIGAVFASLEAGIKFYEVYARACGFTPRRHSTKTLRGGVAHQKFVVCNRQGFRESKPKQRPRTKDDENMGDDKVKELVNGYENIGATLIDFKNFQRDIKCYIGLRDADLFIDRLEKLKATQPQFYFAYDVDPQNRLTKFFWADATCVNHHRKSVLFAGCLLLHEDDISFQWTFQRFLDRHGTKRARFMITDQCPGIKKAFLLVFKTARHRYCMWHITQKITDKVGSTLCRDTDFLARFNAVVWDPDMEPSEFEEKWRKVPNRYGQRSQRYTRRCDDYNNDHSFPELKTELPIEKHGAIIYTHSVFKVFQEEVMAADSCGVDDFEKEEHLRIIHAYFVGVQGQRNWTNTKQLVVQVTIHPPEQARNKGSGKRLKSAKQQAIEKAAKPKRLCAYCKERVTHDRRTCPLRIADVVALRKLKRKSLILCYDVTK